jgi:hypothetical protein
VVGELEKSGVSEQSDEPIRKKFEIRKEVADKFIERKGGWSDELDELMVETWSEPKTPSEVQTLEAGYCDTSGIGEHEERPYTSGKDHSSGSWQDKLLNRDEKISPAVEDNSKNWGNKLKGKMRGKSVLENGRISWFGL